MKDKNKFKAMMMSIGEIFDKEISQSLLEVYWRVLEPFSDAQASRALNHAISTCKFFPKPADIIEILTVKLEDKAILAWVQVEDAVRKIGNYVSVKFVDDPVIHSCLEAMGGWHRVGEWKEQEMVWKRKEFETFYMIYDCKEKHPDYLPGWSEINNRANNFHIRKPILIGGDHGRIKGSIRKEIRAGVCGDSGGSTREREGITHSN